MQLGMHVAVDRDSAVALGAAADDLALETLVEEIEERGRYLDSVDSDKAWDPILCALSPDGYDRTPSTWPAHGVVLGGRTLNVDEDAGLITLLDPDQVAEVSTFLTGVTEQGFAELYRAMDPELRNPEFGDEELGYAWVNLVDLREFFARVAARGDLSVVFSVAY